MNCTNCTPKKGKQLGADQVLQPSRAIGDVSCELSAKKPKTIYKIGTYFRSNDSKTIQRYKCLVCNRSFSTATTDPAFGQKKRRVNWPLFVGLSSGMSQRRLARNLNIDPKTVARKLIYLATQCRIKHAMSLKQWAENGGVAHIQFDELQTIEHTKCKPLSVPVAVAKDRRILGFRVASMPATGHLSKVAKKKYGYRPNHRYRELISLFKDIQSTIQPKAMIESDEASFYERTVKRYFPKADYVQFKGEKAAVIGQGELKKKGRDPLFTINHTLAMLRYDINRLIRKSWCTTKDPARLNDHLAIYTWYYNHIHLKVA